MLTAAVALVGGLLPGVTLEKGVKGLLEFAVVLGLLNAIVRPVLRLISVPLILVTFGLFAVVINVAMFALANYLTHTLKISSLLTMILASLLVSLVALILNRFVGS